MKAKPPCGLMAALILLLSAPAALAAECRIERAIYRPVGGYAQSANGGYELAHAAKAVLVNQSQLVLTIRQAGSGRAHDFGFAFSNGYGRTHLIYSGPDRYESENPDADRNDDTAGPGSPIMYFDARLRAVEAPTKPGEAAPSYLIMPEIGVKFWYDGKDERKFVPPDGMWRLASCR